MNEETPGTHSDNLPSPGGKGAECEGGSDCIAISGDLQPTELQPDPLPVAEVVEDSVSEHGLSKGRRTRHRTMLAVACFVVLLAVQLHVREDERVEFRWLPGIALPESCWSKAYFNVRCPGCGLTRSVVYLSQGDWRNSLSEHRIGFIMALAILAQFPYCFVGLYYKKDYPLGRRFASVVACTLIALLIGNWFYDLLAGAV